MTAIWWDQLELPFVDDAPVAAVACLSPLAPFTECPLCGGDLAPEHAHFRCGACGWRDSCCD
jgi:hypothetical protein